MKTRTISTSTNRLSVWGKVGPFLFALLTCSYSSVVAEITREECVNEGGEVIGDIGNGAIFQSDYICANTQEPPTDIVVPDVGQALGIEGEVCCGGTGAGAGAGGGMGNVLSPLESSVPPRISMSRAECTGNEYNGMIIGDIGNGAIYEDDYMCESNGLPPIGNVMPLEGEPISMEGEVCCASATSTTTTTTTPNGTTERATVSRQECETVLGGIVTNDIGNGAIHRSDYKCETTGESPIATILPAEGEPMAREGQVCCGAAAVSTATNTTTTITPGNLTDGPNVTSSNGGEEEEETKSHNGGNTTSMIMTSGAFQLATIRYIVGTGIVTVLLLYVTV